MKTRPSLRYPVRSSFWGDLRPHGHAPLARHVQCDVVVIGGGLAGLSTAYFLATADDPLHVVVLEADAVGSGASGRNFGTVAVTSRDELPRLVDDWGEHWAASFVAYQQAMFQAFTSLLATIGCTFLPTNLLLLARTPEDYARMVTLARFHRHFGLESRLISQDEIGTFINLGSAGGLSCGQHGWIQPRELVRAMYGAVTELGVEVFESSPVSRIEESSTGVLVRSDRGLVRAQWAVLTTNAYPSLLSRVDCAISPRSTYVLATEPLDEGQSQAFSWHPAHRTILDSSAPDGRYYMQLLPTGQFLMGGGAYLPAGQVNIPPDVNNRPQYERIHAEMVRRFPWLESARIDCAWGGPIAATPSRLPILTVSEGGRVVLNLGYNARGVLPATMSGRLVRSRLVRPENRDEDDYRYTQLLEHINASPTRVSP